MACFLGEGSLHLLCEEECGSKAEYGTYDSKRQEKLFSSVLIARSYVGK